MAITVIAVQPNQTIPPNLVDNPPHIFSGIVECVFRGDHADADGVTRDTLSFTVGRVNLNTEPPVASCVASLASIAFDGSVSNALWAVDYTEVPSFVNVDRGSGTADLQVVVHLAVRGLNDLILRVNYIVFYRF
jgi:hypothetical protein